jgi:KRAB domain-containing zinc finger protein
MEKSATNVTNVTFSDPSGDVEKSGEKSIKCNQCDYAFSHIGNLRTHLKTHSGEKSIKCYQCDYAFSHAGNLRTHLKMHSEEKSNKCNQ